MSHLPSEYDEAQAIEAYFQSHWKSYMSDFEKTCYNLGLRLEKAKVSSLPTWANKVFTEYHLADDNVMTALADGFSAFEQGVRSRIIEEFRTGVWPLNRCPKCNRILRTPKAQQCFWCGHDWHEIASKESPS